MKLLDYTVFIALFLVLALYDVASACDCFMDEARAVWTDALLIPKFDSLDVLRKDFILPEFVTQGLAGSSFGPKPSNVEVKNGQVHLNVQGQTTRGAEMQSWRDDILFGSFTAAVTYPTIAGTCAGVFVIMPGTNATLENGELDIEYLSSKPDVFHYVVHPRKFLADGNADPESFQISLQEPQAAGTRIVRLDWIPGQVNFFVNSKWTVTMRTKVDAPAVFIVNHWTNGDPNWSGGPPAQTSSLVIEWLSLAFNTTTPKQCRKVCPLSAKPTEYISTSASPLWSPSWLSVVLLLLL